MALVELQNGLKVEGKITSIDKVNMKITIVNATRYSTETPDLLKKEFFPELVIEKNEIKEVKKINYDIVSKFNSSDNQNIYIIPSPANRKNPQFRLSDDGFFDNLNSLTNNEERKEVHRYNDRNSETFFGNDKTFTPKNYREPLNFLQKRMFLTPKHNKHYQNRYQPKINNYYESDDYKGYNNYSQRNYSKSYYNDNYYNNYHQRTNYKGNQYSTYNYYDNQYKYKPYHSNYDNSNYNEIHSNYNNYNSKYSNNNTGKYNQTNYYTGNYDYYDNQQKYIDRRDDYYYNKNSFQGKQYGQRAYRGKRQEYY